PPQLVPHSLLHRHASVHPTPTLFPYTTLFRSQAHEDRHRGPGAAALSSAQACRGGRDRRPALQRPAHIRRRPFRLRPYLQDLRRDRKSTRLNSSHEWISYAVFCLKKKKNTKQK